MYILYNVDVYNFILYQREIMGFEEYRRKNLYLEMRNSLPEKIRVWLEISIKYGNELIILHILTSHGRVEVTSLVPCTYQSVAVNDVDSLFLPLSDLSPD